MFVMPPFHGLRRAANIVETPVCIRERLGSVDRALGTLRRVDAMASLLDGPRARGGFLLRVELDPPWAMRIEDGAPLSLVVLHPRGGVARGAVVAPEWLIRGHGAAIWAGADRNQNARGPPSGCADAGSFVHDFPSSGLADALPHQHRSVRHVSPVAVDHPRVGAPAADGGWAVTTFAAAYLVGGPSFGSLADRTSRSRVLGIGLAVFALANLATALAGSFAVLLAVRALAGLAASGVTPSVYALVGGAAPPGEAGDVAGRRDLGAADRADHRRARGHLMAEVVGWRGVFVVMAIASVLILGLIRASAVRRRRPTAAVGAPGPSHEPVATAAPPPPGATPVSTSLRLRAVSVTTLWALAVYGIYTYLGTILTTIAHLTSGLLAAALSANLG